MANQRWKDDIAYAMNPFKYITWPIGVWPLQVRNFFSLMRCILLLCCASIIMGFPIIEFFLGCTDADQNMDCFVFVNCAIVATLKITSFRIYGNNLTDNYKSAVNDYLTIENEKQRAIMRRYAYMGRIVFYIMMSINYFCCTVIGLIPILVVDKNKYINVTNDGPVREYVLPSRCALEYFNPSNNMYRILCVIEAIAVLFMSNSYIGVDAMFLNITLHMCGQLEILKINFMNIDVTSMKVSDNFTALIERHNYLIRRTKQLIDTINFVLLIQLFMSSILYCTVGFQLILSLKMNDTPIFMKSFLTLITLTVQLALYSFVSDYLKSQMDEVGNFLYQSAWYDFPIKLMKRMIFILMRTQYPIALQAGHFIEINLSTYMNIIKTSVSYLSVLRVMMEV